MFSSMFPIPSPTKKYVVVSTFHNSDWYLADANKILDAIVRKWTSDVNQAIQFDKEADAETVAYMVGMYSNFKIGGIS